MFHPDILTMLDSTPVTSPEQWPARRRELLDILDREQYGLWPVFNDTTKGSVTEEISPCCAGHARHERLSISFDTPCGEFSFPMQFVFPSDGQAHPLMLHINFQPNLYSHYCPVEEIIDNGFALGYICYSDVTTDDADMTNGLSGCYPRNNPATDWGKLSMWAFAASRTLDYLLTRPEVDGQNVAVIGHSRLGKAALLCGAHDERIRFVLANCSGCGGDALEQTKHPGAETYAFMDKTFAYWFCGNRKKYIADHSAMPYDQHFLLAAIAPRYAATGSAAEDTWADPLSQQLCCIAASPAWALHGLQGFAGPEEQIGLNTSWPEGCIGHHLRDGVHFLSRQDWLRYMAFVRQHLHIEHQRT